MSNLPPRLEQIVDDFSYCEGTEKLELLLQYAEQLPALPDWLQGKQAEMDQVHECLTPVFIYPENKDGRFYFHFDIPPESPTVRGFAAVLQEGLAGCATAEITAVPDAFHQQMGLQTVLSGQRLNGITAMLAHIKSLVQPAN